MSEIMALALQGMQGDAARVEQIAANLANALTPGYKRGVAVQTPPVVSFSAHLSGAEALQTSPEGSAGGLVFRTDERPGTLKLTGQPLDLAIAGPGYFEVITDDGPAYTRQGSLRVDANGRLVTAQGYPVMGQAGEIALTQSNPTITRSGAVLPPDGSEDAPIARLKLVTFDGGAPGQRVGDGLRAAGDGMRLLAEDEVQLRQGSTENSNVVPSLEMTALIHAMRHFETMQKVTQGYDDMLGTAIRKLGDAS